MDGTKTELETKLAASVNGGVEGKHPDNTTAETPRASRRAMKPTKKQSTKTMALRSGRGDVEPPVERMTLRQKLGEVRRRIGYIQKRGYNERQDYNYVTAADIAGTVGDILAELGVVVIPRLENITYEAHMPGRPDAARSARVVMAYAFTDADSGEEITAKVAGEGLDVGDKAPYKAMTGALKYALLQSFLLATGDDPEDERAVRAAAGPERQITPEQVRELQALIGETGTDVERVLAYYKVSALGDLSETSYRRALDVLNRKLAKRSQETGAHAQN